VLDLKGADKWIVITIAVCFSIIIAAYILSNSDRYRSIPNEGTTAMTILDTKTGDVFIESTTVKSGKRVWIRKRLRKGAYTDN